MQVAFAALGKLAAAIGLGGAGSGAVEAGTGLVASGGGLASSGVLGVLQGVSTAVGILGKIGAANAAKQQADDMAFQSQMEAGQDRIQSLQKQTEMSRNLAKVLGENDVAFASAGIDISQGVAASARANARREAQQQITLSRRDSDFRQAMRNLRAQGYRRQGNSVVGGALLSALGSGVDYGISLAQRG